MDQKSNHDHANRQNGNEQVEAIQARRKGCEISLARFVLQSLQVRWLVPPGMRLEFGVTRSPVT
jgi:hypothetical protein